MTVEMLDELRYKCIFIPDWNCPIETPEIPLEVCKICLEARKIHSKPVTISRQVVRAEARPAQKEALTESEVPQIVYPR